SPRGRTVVPHPTASPPPRSAPSRVLQVTSPTRGPPPPRAASASTGLLGDPTPPDICVPPLTRARSLFITLADCVGLPDRYLAISTGLGSTARSFRRPSVMVTFTSVSRDKSSV